jgi:two-component sensor histidine kinase
MSLRVRLSVLVAIAVTPPLALTAYNAYSWRNFLERQASDDALASARQVSAELIQLLEGSRHVMLTMMKHAAVPGREEECTTYFKSVIADLPIYREAAFIDRDGKFHCSTIPIPPSLDVHDRPYFYEPLQNGELTVGTLTVGRVTGAPSIHVSIPYRSPDGRLDGVAVLILNPEKIAEEFAGRSWPPNRQMSVFDRDGSLVMVVPRQQENAAREIGKQLFEHVRNAAAGTLVVGDKPAEQTIVGFAPSSETPNGLLVAVGISRQAALAQATALLWRNMVLAAIMVAIATFGTWLAAHFLIRRPVLMMVDTARRREAGDVSANFPRMRSASELGQLSTALAGMSKKVDQLLEQKVFLLRELQHRVMNSLNILSSLLMLQGKHTAEPIVREQLSRARDRVLAMGAVYRHLYSTDTPGPVEFGDFLKMICSDSERAYGGGSRVVITCETEPLEVSGSQATSLAVLAHELITNALKHAYPEGERGTISVRLTRTADGGSELRFSDRGRGMPANLNLEQPNSLGLRVIMATARQFGGTVTINRLDPGTEFLIRFPPDFDPSNRVKPSDAA